MPRPCCLRHVRRAPCAACFKPTGIPVRHLEEVVLGLDELEALRLADLDGLYQEQAAGRMGISRPTFSRIIEEARRKVADALIHGKALRMEGGAVIVKGDETMPGHDGTGPLGQGRGGCGCGQGRGAQVGGCGSKGRRGRGRCRAGRGQAVRPAAAGEGAES